METRRIAVFAFLIAIGIGLLTWFANYLASGTVVVTTGSNTSTITLQKTSGGKSFTKIRTGSLSATIQHGQYMATVRDGAKMSIQVINFERGHKSFRYSVPLTNPTRMEAVAYKNASSIEATAEQLVYLDPPSGALYQIDASNTVTKVSGSPQLQSVEWANPSFGVGQDKNGRLYTVAGGEVSPLKVPFSYSGGLVNFAVSQDEKIYVSYGPAVYVRDQTGSFKKIYTAPSPKPQLTAGDGIVAITNSKYGKTPSGVSKPSLAVVSASGKIYKKGLEAERLTWSPGGRYLASVNQANPTIYDTSLHQVAVMPTTSVVGQFEWLDDSTLLYTLSGQLWSYNVTSQKAQLLSNLPVADSIDGMYVSADKAFAYITTFNIPSNTHTINRVSLKGQSVPDYVYNLQGSLPLSFGGYSVTMINFALPPTIVIQTYSDSPPGDYSQRTTTYLQSLGFDTNQFKFKVNGPNSY